MKKFKKLVIDFENKIFELDGEDISDCCGLSLSIQGSEANLEIVRSYSNKD